MTDFVLRGLSPQPFSHLFGLDDEALVRHAARRYVVDRSPGFPDRIEMRDLEPGERAILVNYRHQNADSPYRASHAVFVREGATVAYEARNRVPDVLRIRTLSVRGFDTNGMMTGAELVEGTSLESAIERLFADPSADYLHVHYATYGCYAARVDR
jgi:hypothetical protein